MTNVLDHSCYLCLSQDFLLRLTGTRPSLWRKVLRRSTLTCPCPWRKQRSSMLRPLLLMMSCRRFGYSSSKSVLVVFTAKDHGHPLCDISHICRGSQHVKRIVWGYCFPFPAVHTTLGKQKRTYSRVLVWTECAAHASHLLTFNLSTSHPESSHLPGTCSHPPRPAEDEAGKSWWEKECEGREEER